MVGHIAGGYSVHVRVGAANAGHTVYVDGEKHVVQQLPVAVYANPWARPVIGAGALISPGILIAEIEVNKAWRHAKGLPPLALYVDYRAHAVTEAHIRHEAETDLAERIGSTSTTAREGIGSAQAARALRVGYALAKDVLADRLKYNQTHWIHWCDSAKLLHDAAIFGTNVLLEGTQGTGLSNTTGFYPYVTSRDTLAGALAAQCGIGPRAIDQVILVARTFPIRVAGNSGPFYPDSTEIAWADIGIDEADEKTTVTKKVRRVATFSHWQIRDAVKLNSASEIALTFADYLCPELKDMSGQMAAEEFAVYDRVGPMVKRIEDQTLCPVTMIGTGPASVIDRTPGV